MDIAVVQIGLADHTMSTNRNDQLFDIIRNHIIAPLHQRCRLTGLGQRQSAARRNAQMQLFIMARGINHIQNIVDDRAIIRTWLACC